MNDVPHNPRVVTSYPYLEGLSCMMAFLPGGVKEMVKKMALWK